MIHATPYPPVRRAAAPLSTEKIASMIDHTNLKPEATRDDILAACEVAKKHKTASVCVNPYRVKLAADALLGSGVAVCSVIGFPLGATTTAQKAFETRTAIADGADEIDMVMNIGAFKDGDYDTVRSDIAAVVEAAGGHTVKVILENHYLQPQEIVEACHLAEQGGADFVKTSTGFAGSGAKVEDVALMRASVSPHIKVKAAGGVGSLEDARKMAEAGADRFGASRTEQILAGQTTASGY